VAVKTTTFQFAPVRTDATASFRSLSMIYPIVYGYFQCRSIIYRCPGY